MRFILFLVVCAALSPLGDLNAQEENPSQAGRNMRIQKIVRDILGTTVTLNFRETSPRTGRLVRADATEFVLESDGVAEKYRTITIRSISIGPGISEGLLVVVASVLCGGFGLGVATLSFNETSSGVQSAVALVFGLFGGWIGYENFFQTTELIMP